MTKTKRRPLTLVEWEQVGQNYREIIATLNRIESALWLTTPADVRNKWTRLRHNLGDMQSEIEWPAQDQCAERGEHPNFGSMFCTDRPLRMSFDDPESHLYSWCTPRSMSRLPLTRQEWMTVGDDVKRTRSLLHEIGTAVALFAPKAKAMRWHKVADKIDLLKLELTGFVLQQHPEWPEFDEVFYEKLQRKFPRLFVG